MRRCTYARVQLDRDGLARGDVDAVEPVESLERDAARARARRLHEAEDNLVRVDAAGVGDLRKRLGSASQATPKLFLVRWGLRDSH